MTAQVFDNIEWRAGMRIVVGGIPIYVVSVDFHSREIAYEDTSGLIWVDCEYVTLKTNRK